MIEKKFAKVIRAFVTNFDANGGAVATCLKLSFKRSNEITDLFIINVQIAIARYAKLVATINIESGEQALYVYPNDRGEEHEIVLTWSANAVR